MRVKWRFLLLIYLICGEYCIGRNDSHKCILRKIPLFTLASSVGSLTTASHDREFESGLDYRNKKIAKVCKPAKMVGDSEPNFE